ncbi:MAG: hypothetical protein RIG56_03870, partial [Thalassobaculum sp.]
GLLSVIVEDGDRDPKAMAEAIRRLPAQKLPSEATGLELLDGLDRVAQLVDRWVVARAARPVVPFRQQA